MSSIRTLVMVALFALIGCAEPPPPFEEDSSIDVGGDVSQCVSTSDRCSTPYGGRTATYIGYEAFSNGDCTGGTKGAYQCAQFAKDFYENGPLNHSPGFTQSWTPVVNERYVNRALDAEEDHPNAGDPLFVFRSSHSGWNGLTEYPRETDVLVFENGGAGHIVIARGVEQYSDTEIHIPIIEENVAIKDAPNAELNGPGGSCHNRVLIGRKSSGEWIVESGIGASYRYTGFIRHNLAGIFADTGWHSDGSSKAFRDKYVQYGRKLGWAFNDHGGGPFVHKVYGVKLQNFVNTDPSDRFGTDGETALAAAPSGGISLLKEGFWGAYKCIPGSDGYAMGGAEYLGAPLTDEFPGLVDGNCQPIESSDSSSAYQLFERGCMWWRNAVDGKVHVHLYNGEEINAERATACGVQVENNPPTADCVDDCSPGTQECYGASQLRICGHPGTDSCYHWLTLSCGGGTVCVNDECVLPEPSSPVPSCDATVAESCTCETGTTGRRWWRADCSGYTECVCDEPVTTPVSSASGTGGAPAVASIDSATGGSASTVSSATTGGMVVVSASGGMTIISTGGMTATPNNPTTPTTAVVPAQSGTTDTGTSFVLTYEGPVTGAISVSGWWMNPDGTVREWGPVTECADGNAFDSVLECVLLIEPGSRTFEFQVNLPGGRYWGDFSCDPTGGCGQSIGTVTLARGSQIVAYAMSPNNTVGDPYYNGYVDIVP